LKKKKFFIFLINMHSYGITCMH